MLSRCIIGVALIVFLTGCATAKSPSTVSQLQIRVAQLENQLDERDQDVQELKYAVETLVTSVDRLASSSASVRTSSGAARTSTSGTSESGSQEILRVPVTPQQVQTALKSAGYYDGAIDGKLGSGSQKAIKDFQKDHNLGSDGIVGKKTWDALKSYAE